jgi:hypothetical protein
MRKSVRVTADAVRSLLMGTEEPGVFERVLGFRAATGKIRSVHIMNDLAQCALGGAPEHGGDYLCQIVRPDDDDGQNSEEALRKSKRFGSAFSSAFPSDLGSRRVDALRRAAATVLNFDRGVYRAGDRMASALATHRDLLGFEGFRRFQVGRYLAYVLGEEGSRQVRELYLEDRDPLTRAFRPLLLPGKLVDTQKHRALPPRTVFDEALGRGLKTLLSQRLTKPALLRALAIASSMGVILKILGCGRKDGVPVVLALAAEREAVGGRDLREDAVTSLRRCVVEFDRACARELATDPGVVALLEGERQTAATIEVRPDQPVAEACAELIAGARKQGAASRAADDDGKVIYWPDRFALGLGRQAGIILPRDDRAGWGKYFALSPEHVEVLTLMHVPHGERRPWRDFWRSVREGLGVLVGANAPAEAVALREAGVPHVGVESLAANANELLAQACRRAVARRLPDSGAEVGGVS